MSFLDALNHLFNLFGPALGVGLLASTLAKLLWRRRLAAVPWRRLAAWACAAGALATVFGLIALGRDGRMATYAVLVGACATALWWAGFARGR